MDSPVLIIIVMPLIIITLGMLIYILYTQRLRKSVQVGAWGNTSKSDTTHWKNALPDATYRFTEIIIKYNKNCVTFVQFISDNSNKGNQLHNSENFGGNSVGDDKDDVIKILDGEYINEVGGTVDSYGGSTVITSLTFKVGGNKPNTYGNVAGTAFSLSLVKGKFTGFYGGKSANLDYFGVYVYP